VAEYEPGTLAVATVRGQKDVRVVSCGRGGRHEFWWSPEFVVEWRQHDDRHVTDVRPLAVLDPKDYPRLSRAWENTSVAMKQGHSLPFVLDRLRKDIEAQTKPPRIPEPGLWGVVEAKPSTDPETKRQEFVRYPSQGDSPDRWESKWFGSMAWDELLDPVLIRPGVDD
jgi:hypothetical protein